MIKQSNVPSPEASIPNLNSSITSYEKLDNDREFVIAYYLANQSNVFRFPLFVTRFDKQTRVWSNVALTDLKLKGFGGPGQEVQTDCIGSVTQLQSNRRKYYMSLAYVAICGLPGHFGS